MSPVSACSRATGNAWGGTGAGLATRRKAQKAAHAASKAQITNADNFAAMGNDYQRCPHQRALKKPLLVALMPKVLLHNRRLAFHWAP